MKYLATMIFAFSSYSASAQVLLGHEGLDGFAAQQDIDRDEALIENPEELPYFSQNKKTLFDRDKRDEALEEAQSLCKEMLSKFNQDRLFYGFWAMPTTVNARQELFPRDFSHFNKRHRENSTACKRVTLNATYGLSNKAEKGTFTRAALASLAYFARDLSLYPESAKLQSEQITALAMVETKCEARPEEERLLLNKVYECDNADRKLDIYKKGISRAAREGNNEEIAKYRKQIDEVLESKPSGCAIALENAKKLAPTEFVQADEDSCSLTENN